MLYVFLRTRLHHSNFFLYLQRFVTQLAAVTFQTLAPGVYVNVAQALPVKQQLQRVVQVAPVFAAQVVHVLVPQRYQNAYGAMEAHQICQ